MEVWNVQNVTINMKKGNKTYWKGIEQLKNDKEFIKNAHNDYAEYLPINMLLRT